MSDAPPGPTVPKKMVNLTPAQWAEAESLWETGEFELRDLSKKFSGIRVESLSRHFKKRGIMKGANTAGAAVRKAAAEAAGGPDSLASRVKSTREQHYKWFQYLAAAQMTLVTKAKSDGVPLAAILEDVRAIKEVISSHKMAWEARASILGIDKQDVAPEELPQLVVRGLTAEEMEQLRNRQVAEDEELADIASGAIEEDEFEEELDEEGVDELEQGIDGSV